MNNKITLSVILPVLNDQENLDRILGELGANPPVEDWELIIVDDGSEEPLLLGGNPPRNWQLIRNTKRMGAAASRNIGVQETVGEYVVFLSVFLKIPTDYLSRLKQFLVETEFDFAQHAIEKAPEITATHFQSFLAGQKERLGSGKSNLSIKQSLFTAAVMKTELFCSLKGFDDSMNHYGGHELDFIYRLDRAGYQKRILISSIPLERVKLEDHQKTKNRLVEYGQVGLPNLLLKHRGVKDRILIYPLFWKMISFTGFTHWIEKVLNQKVIADQPLPVWVYRLYLHLIVRNAWDAR